MATKGDDDDGSGEFFGYGHMERVEEGSSVGRITSNGTTIVAFVVSISELAWTT